MREYTIVADHYPRRDYERKIKALTETDARKKFWEQLTPEQRDTVASLGVVEVKNV